MSEDNKTLNEIVSVLISERKRDYRNKIISGDGVQSQYTSAIFQLDTDKPEEVSKQSELVLSALPQANNF